MTRKLVYQALTVACVFLSLVMIAHRLSLIPEVSEDVNPGISPNIQGETSDKVESKVVNDTLVTVDNFTITDCVSGQVLRRVRTPFTARDLRTYQNGDVYKEDPAVRQKAFAKIFKNREWGGAKDKGYEDVQASGPGSRLSTTKHVVRALDAVIDKVKKALQKKVIRLLDIPCGDMVWMNEYLKTRTDVQYVGMDIVLELIKKHKTRYGLRKNLTFLHQDVAHSQISQPFDLIFSRQMTQHLRTADTLKVLQHFSGSGSGFLLITDYPSQRPALGDLDTRKQYRFRPQNLGLDPYRLAPPTCLVPDGVSRLALYRLPLLRVETCQNLVSEGKGHKFITCV